MNRRAWLSVGCAGLLQALAAPLWAKDDSAAPVMTLTGMDINGNKIALSDFLGKTVLVSFFTADCALCTRDLKLMRDFYVANVQHNFVLLGVDIDPDKRDVETYNQVVAMAVPKEQRFPMVWRNGPGYKDNFGPINRRPTHFVINRKNEFVFKREGSFQPEDWNNLATSLQQ